MIWESFSGFPGCKKVSIAIYVYLGPYFGHFFIPGLLKIWAKWLETFRKHASNKVHERCVRIKTIKASLKQQKPSKKQFLVKIWKKETIWIVFFGTFYPLSTRNFERSCSLSCSKGYLRIMMISHFLHLCPSSKEI